MNLTTKESKPISPRLAGAVFFAIYALLFTFFAKYTLLSLKDSSLLPLLPSLLVTSLAGAFTGYIFGKSLAKKGSWLRLFLLGILLAYLAFILSSLGILTYFYLKNPDSFALHNWKDSFVIYGTIFTALFLTIGLWLIPLTGLIAIYFNKHFFPGLLAADQQRLQETAQQKQATTETKIDNKHD